MADGHPNEDDTVLRPALPSAWCVRCGKHVVTYRDFAPPGDGGLVHRCLVCDAALAREPAGAAVDDGAAATAWVSYDEALALGFGYPDDLPAPEEGGCGGGCGSGCGSGGGGAGGAPPGGAA